MLQFADNFRERNIGLLVLNLGGDVDTKTPIGAMVFTVVAALAQMELKMRRERINDSVNKRRTTGENLGGRRPTFTNSQIRTVARLLQAGEPPTQIDKDMGIPRTNLHRRINEQKP